MYCNVVETRGVDDTRRSLPVVVLAAVDVGALLRALFYVKVRRDNLVHHLGMQQPSTYRIVQQYPVTRVRTRVRTDDT